MALQLELDKSAAVDGGRDEAGVHNIAADLAYIRLAIVNVVLYGEAGAPGWVLVDAGLVGTERQIIAAAERRFGTNVPPSAIVLTHGHFDHVGALDRLLRHWDVPVFAHALEHPFLNGRQSYPPPDAANKGLMARLSPLFPRGPIDIGHHLNLLPADGTLPEMVGWQWLHTPGHTPGHVSLWHPERRHLIVGDAFVTTGQESVYEAATQQLEMHGPPQYFTPGWAEAGRSVRALAALEPELAITGHGRPIGGPLLRSSLHQLADQFETIAVPAHARLAVGNRSDRGLR
jgi:glyoxylase-like metal-dependent hydrolase (beta-lactamase superfamily II)